MKSSVKKPIVKKRMRGSDPVKAITNSLKGLVGEGCLAIFACEDEKNEPQKLNVRYHVQDHKLVKNLDESWSKQPNGWTSFGCDPEKTKKWYLMATSCLLIWKRACNQLRLDESVSRAMKDIMEEWKAEGFVNAIHDAGKLVKLEQGA